MSEAGPPRLSMRGITKRFGPTVALAGVDLSVQRGEIHALLGENGAGKSTLMRILSGAVRPDSGVIALDGTILGSHDPLAGRRAGIAMIYQELSLAPDLTVAENVYLGVEPTRFGRLDRRSMRAGAIHALGQLGHGGIDPDEPVARLSLAERQVVEIARALSIGCRVLVLDEPTSALGRPDAERLFDTMRMLASRGHAIVYITHFLEDALTVAERYTVLRDGRNVATGATSDTTADEIVSIMVGQTTAVAYPRSSRTCGEPILTLDAVAGTRKPLSARLTLHRGEIVGIFGLVGSGRTELIRAIFGLDPVISGTVRIKAFTGPLAPDRQWAAGVGMVSEDRAAEGLALGMSVADNLMLTRLGPGPLSPITRRRQRRGALELIARLGIRASDPFQAVNELSGGNQQKVALGRLLHHDVDILLLDEPTRGIDVGSKREIYQLIDALVSECVPPKAVLVTGSFLPELRAVCDRIAVMKRGLLGPAVPVTETDDHSLLLAASG